MRTLEILVGRGTLNPTKKDKMNKEGKRRDWDQPEGKSKKVESRKRKNENEGERENGTM